MAKTILNLDVFEQRFRNLFKEAPFSAALLSGDDFLIEMANEATLKLWGKDESILGKPLLVAMPEMQGQDVFQSLALVYKTGEPFEGRESVAYLKINGALEKVYVSFIFKAIRNDDNHIEGVLAVGYDVTDQVIAKQKLEQSDLRARVAIESAGMGTFEKDLKTGEVYSSRRFNDIFGFDDIKHHEDYVSKIHPEDLVIRETAHNLGLSDGIFSYESRIIPHAGIERWIKVNGTYLFNKQQEPVRLIGTVLDITAEKHALQNIRESEERYRTLITETPEVGMALYTGPEIRIKYVNEMMLKFWSKDESVVGQTFLDALPVLEGQPFFDQLETVLRTGIPYKGHEQKAIFEHNQIPDTRYFNYVLKPLKDLHGKIYGIHHMAIDVTDQVKYKLALLESETSVRSLFEQTPVGIAVFKGTSLKIEMANDAMLTYWGSNRHEVINRPAWEALPEIKLQGIDIIAQKVLQTGIPYTSPETSVQVNRDGSMETVIVHFAFQPLRDMEGEIIGLLAIANDVTEMADARKKVEKNEMRLQSLANSMPQVVWIANEDGAVTYYNDQVQAFAGAYKTASGIWSWEGILHHDDLVRTKETWRLAAEKRTSYQMEHRVKMKDGSYRWHLSRAYPYENDEGLKWYGTATDVHDQKVLEMDLEDLVRERTLELERSNDDLQQFAHVASHDLKEPVRKIKTFSYKLLDEFQNSLGERGQNLINKIIHAADRMSAMINGVLDYASLTANEHKFQHVDLNQIINTILVDLEVLIEEKKATVHFEHLPSIHGNEGLLYQLFYNLINNSLKFSKSSLPTRVDISTDTVVRDSVIYHEITIRDNGIGFDQDKAKQIFMTFFRLNSKDRYEGSGLGLALCKKIVERHGGFIYAKGAEDLGAQFIILLPQK